MSEDAASMGEGHHRAPVQLGGRGVRHVGLIINPIAGIGGRVGLKGSDGAEIQKRARELGATPQALERASQALERLKDIPDLEVVTYPGEMGEDAARACGFEPTVIGSITPGATTAEDTRQAAVEMQRMGVDLLLFAGGDGTARDIYQAIGEDFLTLGIPAGVKIHSAVYATNPASAGNLAALYLQGRIDSTQQAEVMDIDEEAFREGSVSAKLYGYLRVPFRTNLVQNLKMASVGGSASLVAIAEDIAERMEPDCLYIIGPGTTTRAITAELGLAKTLLGVDVVQKLEGEEGGAQLVAADTNEAQLLELIEGHPARIIVTPIGGQGYIFGRGNQQISPRVIEKVISDHLAALTTGAGASSHKRLPDEILVVSTQEKLYSLGNRPLLVDTGDPALDELLSGYITVVTGYRERAVRRVSRQ
jgi:predicted polyphosphate/ATP-dependent NAD kinase